MNGYHDLATPFHLTELDKARLGNQAAGGRVQIRNYPGGHMTYLDDATRVRQKADLAAFYAGTLAVQSERATPLSAVPMSAPDRAGLPTRIRQPSASEPFIQTQRRGPWAPADQVQRALQQQERTAAPSR